MRGNGNIGYTIDEIAKILNLRKSKAREVCRIMYSMNLSLSQAFEVFKSGGTAYGN